MNWLYNSQYGNGGQCLPLSVVQLKGKHCRKPHCHNGVVGRFELSYFRLRDRCRLVSSDHIFEAIIWLLKQFFGSYHEICHVSQLFCQITVQFREGCKSWNRSLSKFWHYWATTKLSGRFFKLFWPSQKTSTLTLLVHSFALAKCL